MIRILMMEGNTASSRAEAAKAGLLSPNEIYRHAIRAHFPDIEIDVVFAADGGGEVPNGRNFSDYDGFVITGSSLHAYDSHPAVTGQIDLLRAAAKAGLPIFGSCWGLQIAVMAAGGCVEPCRLGQELGIARKIAVTTDGRRHPMMVGRDAPFDAPCIHSDEVTKLPPGAVLLASNAHSKVQAASIPLENAEIWAVQYHPEFDLKHLAGLYRRYRDDVISQGFFENASTLENYANELISIADGRSAPGLSWRLGVDADMTDDRRRRLEIINWIRLIE